jgi:hypothetical protein
MGDVRGFGRTIAVAYFRVNLIPDWAEIFGKPVLNGASKLDAAGRRLQSLGAWSKHFSVR